MNQKELFEIDGSKFEHKGFTGIITIRDSGNREAYVSYESLRAFVAEKIRAELIQKIELMDYNDLFNVEIRRIQ